MIRAILSSSNDNGASSARLKQAVSAPGEIDEPALDEVTTMTLKLRWDAYDDDGNWLGYIERAKPLPQQKGLVWAYVQRINKTILLPSLADAKRLFKAESKRADPQ